jgi:hypothetical protein
VPDHVHSYEIIFTLECDPDVLSAPLPLYDEAHYHFCICDCGDTTEVIVGTNRDGTTGLHCVSLSDWQEI